MSEVIKNSQLVPQQLIVDKMRISKKKSIYDKYKKYKRKYLELKRQLAKINYDNKLPNISSK